MANVTYDKKQLPQVIGLGVLSVGIFGYFTAKLITPPAAQASAPQPAATTPTAATATTTDASASAGAAGQPTDGEVATALIGATAPSDEMRDPFVAYTSPAPPAVPALAATPGSPTPGVPSVPGLPGAGDVAPLNPGPVDGGWTVYGVVCSDADPSAALAIFRRGDERRYVRLGTLVDDDTRLIGIDRGGVTVLRFGNRVRLGLGGPTPESKPPAVVSGSTTAPITVPAIATAGSQSSGSLADAVKAALTNSTGSANTSNTPAAAPAAPSATTPAPTLPAGTRPI